MSNSNIPTIDILTDTWQTVITRTDSLINSLSTEILTANSTNGITGSPISPRNATLFGAFSANSILINGNTFSVNSTILTIGNNLKVSANNSTGISGYVLTSGGSSGNVYWAPVSGTVRSVANGAGLLGGTITNSGTLSVKQGFGLVVDSNGVSISNSYFKSYTPKKLSYGQRRPPRTVNQAYKITDSLTANVVGFAKFAGTTGGSESNYSPYIVSSVSKDPAVVFSWGWALDQVTQNNGGTIQFDTRGHFDIVYDNARDLNLTIPNVTIIAPGRNATLWFDPLTSGVKILNTNMIFKNIEFRTLPGLMNNDQEIPCIIANGSPTSTVNTYPVLARSVFVDERNGTRMRLRTTDTLPTPFISGTQEYLANVVSDYVMQVFNKDGTSIFSNNASGNGQAYVSQYLKTGQHKLVSVIPNLADKIAFMGCDFRRASDGALDISSSALAKKVDIDVANDVFTLNNHTFAANATVFFSNTISGATIPTGLTPRRVYYVVNNAFLTTNTFQVSTTPGGSSIAMTGSFTANVFVTYTTRPANTTTGLDDGCRVTIQDSIFWDTDQTMLIGSGLGTSTTDPTLIQATLYNNIFAYCGSRQPKVAGFSYVDMQQCYTTMLPWQRDNNPPLDDSGQIYGIGVANGGKATANGCLWGVADLLPSQPVSPVNSYAALLGPNTDKGALKVNNSIAENSLIIAPANTSLVPAPPYTLSVTPPPAALGTARDSWIDDRWLQAGAKVDSAPEGLFRWYDSTNPIANTVPNGDNVLVERNSLGRWIRITEPVNPTSYTDTAGRVLNVELQNSKYIYATATANNGGASTRIAGINNVNQLYLGTIDAVANVGRVIVQSAEVPNSDLYLMARGDSADVRIYANNNLNSIFKADGKVGIGTSNPTAELEVNGIIKASNIPSILTDLYAGFYTATIPSNSSNIFNASIPTQLQYMQVGNTVTVSGAVTVNVSSLGDTFLHMTLPVASDFSSRYHLAGTTGSYGLSANVQTGVVVANSTLNAALLRYQATITGDVDMFFTYTYRVI